MPLDPFLKPLLAQLPAIPDEITDWEAHRAQVRAQGDLLVPMLAETPPEVGEKRRITIAVEDGSIDLVVYRPFGIGPHPIHLFLHGGGWVIGSVDDAVTDAVARGRCAGAECLVVAVGYRKAPEHKFPTPLNDCYAALRWVAEHAQDLDVRPDRLTVGGQSAGGNLAAALCLKVRDEGGPAIALQLLEVPSLDLTFSLPSQSLHANGYGLSGSEMVKYRRLYLQSPAQSKDPYVSPLLATDLSRLPPAYIMSAEYDPLCDDGAEYAKRLQAAGVPATFSLQQGHIHISGGLTKVMESARAWQREMLGVLKRVNETGQP